MNLQLKSLKVTLIGDTCIDEYQYGSVDRLSPEAPVPIFVPEHREIKHGMAANVADNLEKLGVTVQKYFGEPSTKIRMIDRKSKQHIIRVDRDVVSSPLMFNTSIDCNVDAFVVSDYDKGFVSYELIEQIISTGRPVFIDTKKTDLARLQGAFVKINREEHQRARTYCDNIIITMGDRGAIYQDQQFPTSKIEITDVCGAGDTFLSALCFWYLQTNDISAAIKFAIRAASITVKHVGVYAPTIQEIQCQD
jgi:D-beta-D-heptose 7-phosphate kinase/D-beta-D-heptose 1-phosphate adenosyltransferase